MLIATDKDIRAFIPNTLVTVKGEATLSEKLSSFIALSETWLASSFIGDSLYDTLCKMTEVGGGDDEGNGVKCDGTYTQIRQRCQAIVCYDAFMRAIPSLDLILTPNGFGIVNNSNVVPASRERVERLIASMEASRDKEIAMLLKLLPKVEEWMGCTQYGYFMSTLFCNLDVCNILGTREHTWDGYVELRDQIMNIEMQLAEAYFSDALMEALRAESITGTFTHPLRRHVTMNIRSYITALIRGRDIHTQYLFDIVNVIREQPEVFPEWHSSTLPMLYDFSHFENRRNSTAYFF